MTGSLAFDYIMDFPGVFSDHIMPEKIHKLNVSFLVNTLKKQRGGTAGNIAYNLALLQTPVSIVGFAGRDFSEYENFLKKSGVDTSKVKIAKGNFSSLAFIMTDQNDNQITGFYEGALNKNHTLSIINQAYEFVVISPNSPKAMVKFAREAQQNNIPFMMDPGMQLPRLKNDDLGKMIEGAQILVGNDYEIGLLKHKLGVSENKLLSKVSILISTLGPMGSVIKKGGQTVKVKAAAPTSTVDPTGAGDGYRAGFLAGYLRGFDLKTCGQIGSMAACYTIEKYGTTTHVFTLKEFSKRYKENFGEILKL